MHDPTTETDLHPSHQHRSPDEIAVDEARGLGAVPPGRQISDETTRSQRSELARNTPHPPAESPRIKRRRPRAS